MLAIYGKKKTDKKFLPFDYERGSLVKDKLAMTVFAEKDRHELESTVAFMNVHNPVYQFEIRPVMFSYGMIFAMDYRDKSKKDNRAAII